MPRNKDEALSIRTTGEIKALLREAAGRERRSVASMVEVLVLDYSTFTSRVRVSPITTGMASNTRGNRRPQLKPLSEKTNGPELDATREKATAQITALL